MSGDRESLEPTPPPRGGNYSETRMHFGQEVCKVEHYGWRMKDRRGVYMDIPKAELNVDHRYQREKINHTRVNRLASQWSWAACGALHVGMHPDGSFWVFDGQHRKLAADQRSDIHDLPCMVYETEGVAEEAQRFLDVQTNRGPVSSFGRYRAELVAEDTVALAVRQMLDESGYEVQEGCQGEGIVQCIASLKNEYRKQPEVAKLVWTLCVHIARKGTVNNRLYVGLCYLERFLNKSKHEKGTLAEREWSDKLIALGQGELMQQIHRTTQLYGKGTAKIAAHGLVILLNKNKRKHRLPDVLSSPEENEEG